MDYNQFLEDKKQIGGNYGFQPTFYPTKAFDFQKALIDWSVNKGIGVELKESYFNQAVKNIESLKFEQSKINGDLFSLQKTESEDTI
jgi:hypothetical protein